MLEPVSEHQLLVFWIQLALLVAVARALGGLCRHFALPPVIGELSAGLILGPSLLGRLAPQAEAFLLPDDPVQSGMLYAVSWIGVVMLLVVAGFETDLKLLASLGRGAVSVSLGSLLLPLAGGVLLGYLLPGAFLGEQVTPERGGELSFALFFGIALAVSALPVVARILIDMNLMRRDVGQVTIAAGIANDLVGYVGLGVLAGLVANASVDLWDLATTLAAVAVFSVVMLTAGQRVVDRALRYARRETTGQLRSLSALVLTALILSAVTQWIGVEALLGAFVAGIVLGRSRYLKHEVREAFEVMVSAFFAPVFFATAGLNVDLGILADPRVAAWTLIAVAIAASAKVVGALAGGVLGGFSARQGIAMGVGLNARGAIGVIVGTVGLGLGVLNVTSYTLVVLLSIVTSLMAPPLLRRALAGMEAGPTESARLEREAVLSSSIIAKTRTALLPTRGGTNSVLAGRLLDLALQPEATLTILTAHARGDREARSRAEPAVKALRDVFADRDISRHDRNTDDIVKAILDEAALGYGLVALGMSERFIGGDTISETLRRVLADSRVPLLLVRHGGGLDPTQPLAFRRLLVPATGTAVGQAAQEIAFVVAGRLDAAVDVVHVVTRPDKEPLVAVTEGASGALGSLTRAEQLAARFGRTVHMHTRAGPSVGQELVAAIRDRDCDLVVLGAQLRSFDGRPFLGHDVEYVLEHSDRTVVVMLFPERAQQQ